MPVAVMCLASQLTACATWQAQPITAVRTNDTAGRLDPTKPVRVLRKDGSTITLTDAHIRGDTLYGMPAVRGGAPESTPIATPLTDVRQVQVEKSKLGMIALVVAALLGLSLLVGG